jgi:hypothetical protein
MTELPAGYPVKFCPICTKQLFPHQAREGADRRASKESPAQLRARTFCGLKCYGASLSAKEPWKVTSKATDKTRADEAFNNRAANKSKPPKVRKIPDAEYEERIDAILALAR